MGGEKAGGLYIFVLKPAVTRRQKGHWERREAEKMRHRRWRHDCSIT